MNALSLSKFSLISSRPAAKRAANFKLNASRKISVSRPVLASAQSGTEAPSTSGWDHVLVAIIDSNPSLSTASRSAIATAATLAGSGQLTCLFLDDEGKPIDTARTQMVQQQLEQHGVGKVSILEESIEHSSGQGSVAIGEAADTVNADLVVLSTAVVHDKHVDANLLAEFVPAPVLLLP